MEGSGAGSAPLTNGSGSGSRRPKNMRILLIRIPNTGHWSRTRAILALHASEWGRGYIHFLEKHRICLCCLKICECRECKMMSDYNKIYIVVHSWPTSRWITAGEHKRVHKSIPCTQVLPHRTWIRRLVHTLVFTNSDTLIAVQIVSKSTEN